MTTPNPMYISAHSAEVILSDFRPLKLQPDALRFLNLLLDDILANIITSSRSILTDRLKSGLLKTLPTTMGKDALLEAEMELHAYWQRPNAIKPSTSQTSTSEHSFAVPLMIELMRLKCEAYSTLNDSDEDAQVENKIQERLQSQGVEPPKSIVVAPASLYLTAILECICEHILSSVGRVATRDSSKEVAGTHDLFIALCEDDGIYPMFRVSKVYGLIESSLKSSAKPRRSKSLSRSERHETRDTSSLDPPSQSQPRVSSESTTSGAVSGSVSPEYHPPRSSLDKGRAIKSFRSSGDRDMTLPPDPLFRVTLSKKNVIARDGKDGAAVEAEQEGNVIQDFDDLMRSGDTMKVSLTPDRLRSMEAAKQQQRRTTQQAPKTIVDDHHRASSASEADGRSPTPPDLKYHHPRKSLPHVDEDEELKETAQDVRSRSEVTKPPDTRARSVSTSKIYHSGPRVTRKSSLGIRGPPLQSGLPGRDMYDWRKNAPTTPQRTRKIQRNRESMDIEDVMNGSEEGDESNPDQTAQGRGRLYPVSKATHDLISFLEDGPPPEVQPVRSATVSSISLAPTTKSAKSGSRLQRMISKFSIAREGFQESARGRGVGVISAPSTPVSSLRSLGASNPPPTPIAVKPVPPPIPQLPISPIPQLPISPPSSSRTSSLEDDARPHLSRTDRPRKMSVRKAVPTWESAADQGLQTPHTGAEGTLPPSPPLSSQPVSASSPSPFQPYGHVRSSPTLAPEGKDTNGDTHNHKALRSESPAATPAGIEANLTRENGNGRAEQQYPQGIYRPRSSRPNLRSPSNDEQSHSVRKSLGRRSQPPNGTVDGQLIHPSPSLSEALAVDMRRLMSQATSADECRLLVDTFLTRAGIVPPPPVSVVADITPPDVELLERTLVNYFLGADLDGSQLPQTQSLQAEVKRRSTSSTPKQAQESGDAHLSTATLMDSAHTVYTHHIVSDAVAVVS